MKKAPRVQLARNQIDIEDKAKMTRHARIHVQAALATGQLTLDQWDARRTEDGMVSVIDVIADVTGKTAHYASNVYNDLVREERVPDCEKRSLPPRSHLSVSRNPGHTQRRSGGFSCAVQPTPVATAAEMVEIVWQLPGTADFRRNCAQTVVRYLGGDESLVDEIRRNRAAQERLARDDPTHTARVFGEAVEAEAAGSAPDAAERAEKRRRMRAETDQLEIQNLNTCAQALSACVQALAAIGQNLDDSMIWSYRDRMSNLMRGDANAEQQESNDAGGFLAQTRGMAASLVEKLRIPFGRIAARRLRERDGLPHDAPLPKLRKRCGGSDINVTLFRVPQDAGVLEAAYEELLRSSHYAEATGNQQQASGATHPTQQAGQQRGYQRLFFPRAA